MENSNQATVNQYITEIMPKIEQPPMGKILYPWLSVTYGRHYVSAIYVWDYHHAAMRFAVSGRPEYLRFLVDNYLTYQLDDGNTPSVIFVDRGPRFIEPSYHAQPFLIQAAVLYVHLTSDTSWGESVYGKLIKYLEFYDQHYTAAYGLKRWRVNWMGGLDNDVVNTFLPPDMVASADINAWFYLELLAARKLAYLLERCEDADAFSLRAQRHREIVNEKLWYDKMKTYSALNLCDGTPLFNLPFEEGASVPSEIGRFAFQTSTNLIPLYTRMADPESARAMIETYVISENHFWSPYGIRSLSKASEYYNNAVLGNPSRFSDHRRITESNWQGPVWIPMCYFTFHALRYYGFAKEAGILANNTIDVLANSLSLRGSFAENFNAETGEPLYASCYTSWNLLGDTLHDDLESGQWLMDVIFS